MVKIISDSSTLYTTAQAAAKNLAVVPLNIQIGRQSWKDLDEITSTMLLEKIRQKEIPASSQPSIGEKLACYEENQDADALIDITMAQGLSGTYDSACMAAAQTGRENILVFNSRTLCGPHRGMVDLSLQMAKEGQSAEEILAVLEECANHEISFLVPRDFSFLKRGGRVSKLEAGLGGALRLVPVMIKSEDGQHLETFGITKTFKRAVRNMITEMLKRGADASWTFYVSHAFNEDDALKAAEMLKETFPGARIITLPLSPVFIAQGGPGCVAVQAIRLREKAAR